MTRTKVAVIGSDNIGTDLMFKILRDPGHMELALLTGIDPASEGLARARSLGVATSHDGIQPILDDPDIRIVFDATSAHAHVRHARVLKTAGRIAIDLTPATGDSKGKTILGIYELAGDTRAHDSSSTPGRGELPGAGRRYRLAAPRAPPSCPVSRRPSLMPS